MSRHKATRANRVAELYVPRLPVVTARVRRWALFVETWQVDRHGFARRSLAPSTYGPWLEPWAAPTAVKAWRSARERLIPH